MKTRFYVATKWENRGEARHVKGILESKGYECTYNWMDVEQESSAQAEADMKGVRSADFLVILAQQELSYRGTYAELGAAVALRIPVNMIGHGMDRCIFSKHEVVKCYDTLNDFLNSITIYE